MELKVADDPEQSRYEITADGELAGFVTYELGDGVIELIHTQTDDRFRGHGVGGHAHPGHPRLRPGAAPRGGAHLPVHAPLDQRAPRLP